MKCPNCYSSDTRVQSTREGQFGLIRRRRECFDCHHRFNGYEMSEKALRSVRAILAERYAAQTSERILQQRRKELAIRALTPMLQANPAATRSQCVERISEQFRVSPNKALHWYKSARKSLGISFEHPLKGKDATIRKLLEQGVSMAEVCRTVKCNHRTLKKWIAAQCRNDAAQSPHGLDDAQ